jgi:hypothetical protein
MSFFKKTEIQKYSLEAERSLKDAFHSIRDQDAVSLNDRRLMIEAPQFLSSVNHDARMIWGKAISRQLAEHLCDSGVVHGTDVFFLTLVDVRWVSSVGDRYPDIARFKNNLRVGLRGLSYLGAIEPAYYANVQNGSNIAAKKKCIFWHLHVLVWDITPKKFRTAVASMEASGKYKPLADGWKGAVGKPVVKGELPAVVGYIFKPPLWAYRASGREAANGKFAFIQRKSRLRPGERVNLFHAMKDITLDTLALAGGQGVELLAKARKIALRRIVEDF